MALLRVRVRKILVEDEDLIVLDIESNKKECAWTDGVIRTEDIAQMYSLTKSLTILEFYEERKPLVVKDNIENLAIKVETADYCSEEEEELEEENEVNEDD